ncbi:hypothetical protein [Spirosoma pollinicola]|uniref:Uncharacterized protein n=1 Tax=Spirosoma pollinicola TaxID=2057025 RepID=A0A2K8Z211_9BACT|nr:hypothetical protein [Spirosoma pollinicola]AUD03869.1 hypothetical protein CWM47_19800 [Spirosoma pollinicola]
MSVKNFYQTVYQTDTLFRVAGESWEPTAQSVIEEPVEEQVSGVTIDTPDLLSELDKLSAITPALSVDILLTDAPVAELITVVPEELITLAPEPALVVAAPELLPQLPPRPTTPSIVPPVQKQPRIPQLNHKVLLLADEELDPSNLLFLEKILKAVNLNVNGVDLLNLHGVQGMDFAELLRGKYINHFITFGVPFERINLDIMMDRYSPVRFEGITFLMADSLPTIEADQNLKKRLWSALQRVFSL